ncbi:hypothetical protein RQP46_005651 [Phenoliferia psychrophenolica]
MRWEEADVKSYEWEDFSETLLGIFGQLRPFARVVPIHAEQKYRFICEELIEIIHNQIARQSRVRDSFHSLLPAEILKLIVNFAASDYVEDAVDLALVHSSWRDVSLPFVWQSIDLDLNDDAEVKFFAQVARKTEYSTLSLSIQPGENDAEDLRLTSVDRAVLAVKGLRELCLTTVPVSTSVFESPNLANLTDLTLLIVDLSGDPLKATLSIPFGLRRLMVYYGGELNDISHSYLAAIAASSYETLEELAVDTQAAAHAFLPHFSGNLVSLLLHEVRGETYFSKIDPSTLYFPALRQLALPRSELPSLLETPPADAPPDAPRSTISQAIPHLEHLIISCGHPKVVHGDLVSFERVLSLPVCSALRKFELERAEFDESLTQTETEVFRRMLCSCKAEGVEVRVNGERLC